MLLLLFIFQMLFGATALLFLRVCVSDQPIGEWSFTPFFSATLFLIWTWMNHYDEMWNTSEFGWELFGICYMMEKKNACLCRYIFMCSAIETAKNRALAENMRALMLKRICIYYYIIHTMRCFCLQLVETLLSEQTFHKIMKKKFQN